MAYLRLQRHQGHKDNRRGFNLEQPGAKDLCAKVGADWEKLCDGSAEMTPEQIDAVLNHFIVDSLEWLTILFPEFETYTVNRRAALVDMSFMGHATFCQFHGMIGAIAMNCWATAAQHALDSLWARQVGRRAYDDAELMING